MHTYQDPGMGLVKHWLGKNTGLVKTLAWWAWWDPGLLVEPLQIWKPQLCK